MGVSCWEKVLVVLVLVSSKCQAVLDQNNGIMIPNVKQQELRAGTTITVTCMFIHYVNISWKLPEYLTKYAEVRIQLISVCQLHCSSAIFYWYFHRKWLFFQVSNYNERVSFTAEKNETHVSSTMTIQAARPRDTGLYTCYLPLFGELEVKQYIYVYSNKKIKMPNTFFDTRNFNREEFLYRWAWTSDFRWNSRRQVGLWSHGDRKSPM